MADQNSKDINAVNNITSIDANDYLLVSDQGSALKKVNSNVVSKYAVETYNGTSLGGSNKTVQAAINDLDSRTAWISFNNTDILAQIDALPQGTYNGYFPASNTGNSSMPPVANNSWYVRVNKNSNNFTTVTLEAISNAGNIIFIKHKYNGEWDNEWTKYPTRTEMDALNNKTDLVFTSVSDMNTKISGLTTLMTYTFCTSASDVLTLFDVGNSTIRGIFTRPNSSVVDFTVWLGVNPPTMYTFRLTLSDNTVSYKVKFPTRAEVDTLNSKLSTMSVIANNYDTTDASGTTRTYDLTSNAVYLLVVGKLNTTQTTSGVYVVVAHASASSIVPINEVASNVALVSVNKLVLSVEYKTTYTRTVLTRLG